jgi:hypothetical protein
MSRASHYRAKAKHAQREFAAEKPRPVDPDVASAWIPAYMATLSPGQVLTLETAEIDEIKLRELCRRGLLRMRAVRVGLDFSHFEWTVE